MMRIEQKDYMNSDYSQGNVNRNYRNGNNAKKSGGVGMAVVMIAMMLMFAGILGGVGFLGIQMMDKLSEIAENDEPDIVTIPVYPETDAKEQEQEVEVPLSDMPSIIGNFYDVFTMSNGLKDNVGNVYENAYTFRTKNKITYMLNGEYDWLEGTIAVAYEDKDDLNYAVVYVYDESGNEIFESQWIDRREHPEPVSIRCNVSGLQRITLEFEGADRMAGELSLITEGFQFVKGGAQSGADSSEENRTEGSGIMQGCMNLKERSGLVLESQMEEVKQGFGNLWDSNQEELIRLQDEVFERMSDEDKADALQFLLDLEMTYLGGEGVQLVVYEFEDPTYAGYYKHCGRVVAMNEYMMDRPVEQCIEVCLHEVYHAYQHDCVDSVRSLGVNTNLRMFEEVMDWAWEFDNYIGLTENSTEADYEAYWNQDVEITAREYSEEWTPAYMDYIEAL